MDNTSFEPMDVDLSANSITGTIQMDVSFSEPYREFNTGPIKDELQLTSPNNTVPLPSISTQATGVKVYHIIKKTDRKPAFNSTHIVTSLIIATCLSIVAYQILNVNCSSELDPYFLSEKLHRRVYGQYMALTDIINALKHKSRTKLLFFHGGTGVGKTYTVSLMLENLLNFTNVYHYTMPSFVTTFTTELMLGLTMCNTALFVIDDLIPTDLPHIKRHIIDVVQKNDEMNKNVVIILVFNCYNSDGDLIKKCDDTFYKELGISFSNINALKQFVRFEELSELHLKKCIEDELGETLIDEVKLKNMLKNFNVSLDGCKGVHKKIKILSNS